MANTVLNELLKTDFEQYQVLWNNRRYYSHNAHHLGTLALLGASDNQLKDIYENTMRHYAQKYEPTPHEITKNNWYDSVGDRQFLLAYRDFFNEELPKVGDWKKKFLELLLNDTKGSSLINAAFSGLIHPIIHMAYAVELNSRPVACEALIMTAVCSDSLHKVTIEIKPPTNGKKEALEIMKEIRLDGYVPKVDEPFQINYVLSHQSLLLSHYNEWQISDNLDKSIEELFDMSVYIYGATHKPNQVDFDFVLIHLLTGMNVIRKLRSYFDDNTIKKLLCSFFYLSLAVYIAQQQPKINEDLIKNFNVEEEKFNWKYVVDQTLNTKRAKEVQFIKIIRALKDAEKDYGSKDGLDFKTAIKSVDHLNVDAEWDYYKSHEPWIGMADAHRELNVKH